MRPTLIAGACVLLCGCRSDRAPDVAMRSDTPTTPEAAARQLAGCYVLRAGDSPPYRLQLAAGGDAHLVGPGATANTSGDRWDWSVQTDSAFVVSWSGIDSQMAFNVRRRNASWFADGSVTTVNGQSPLATSIERVRCPPPGA